MDKTDALNVAKIYARAINQNYSNIKVFLFGSYAKGNYTDDSDIDIAVVFNDYNNLMDIQLELMRLRRKIDSRIEPHPFRAKDFELSNPLVNEILRYGQEIIINAA
ncbi:MAG: nucleotidyltransferase domain-containing protein [Bacteroidales bacterium]|nr:nucleotidyltransferase domain-containing protein [Bacteroidales bacterium]